MYLPHPFPPPTGGTKAWLGKTLNWTVNVTKRIPGEAPQVSVGESPQLPNPQKDLGFNQEEHKCFFPPLCVSCLGLQHRDCCKECAMEGMNIGTAFLVENWWTESQVTKQHQGCYRERGPGETNLRKLPILRKSVLILKLYMNIAYPRYF